MPISNPPAPTMLIGELEDAGWSRLRREDSELIKGLSATTLKAPEGRMEVRVEGHGRACAVTLCVPREDADPWGYRSFTSWRASSPWLSARTIGAIAKAATAAIADNEYPVGESEMIIILTARGWTHSQESSHDELLWGALTSPDGDREITWGSGEDDEGWRVARRGENTEIRVGRSVPSTVLCALGEAD
jgi:hypothetical protein